MKLGINSLFLLGFDFEEGLRLSHQLGAQAIEIATLGEPSRRYCDPDKLLADRGELARWLDTIGEHGLEISALTAHGDILSPNREVAEGYLSQFHNICRLAEASGVDCLTLNSGTPEGAPGETTPSWIVDISNAKNRSVLRWQWEQRVIPVWTRLAAIASDHGCQLAIEPWIGNVVHSPLSLMRLREAVGAVIGCNLDPSHLFVQQVDVLETIRFLGDALLHVHMKDTRIDERNLGIRGLLDTTTPMTSPQDRAWTFGLVGWGHDEKFWRDFITNLRFVGYSGAISVEMEVDYLEVSDGLRKSFEFLRPLVMEAPPAPGTNWYEQAGLHGFAQD
jgi:sugar phosphate isomerase/epimerase